MIHNQIGSAADIIEMSGVPADWGAHFLMTADVNMVDYSFSTAVIAPVASTDFTGVFDGGGHRILNFRINSTLTYLGLFGITGEMSEIKNLGMENVSIIGGAWSMTVGSLCAVNGGVISNCYSTGSMSGGGGLDSFPAGGLCALNDGTIINCHSEVSVTGFYGTFVIGGLCARNNGTISNCYATGAVSGGDDSYIFGGLCGYNNGTINSCYASGSVTGGVNSVVYGGLCGENRGGAIINCYSVGAVSGESAVGGLCGMNGWPNHPEESTISNCYAVGLVSGTTSVGGFSGIQYGPSAEMTNSFWDTETTGQSIGYNLDSTYPGTVTNVLGKTTAQMQDPNTFADAGWDFVNESANGTNEKWRMCVGGIDYPDLSWEYSINGDFACPDGVNTNDLISLSYNWLNSEEVDPNFNYACDPTFDGITNTADFGVLFKNW